MMKTAGLTGFILFLFAYSIQAGYGQAVSTVAGTAGVSGYFDAQGTAALFNSPHGIAADRSGNIYIADRFNHRIRKVDASGMVTTFAGTGIIGGTDGPGSAATFNEPWAVDCDTAGNIYVADTKNYKIRMITPAGAVTTVAGQGTFGTTNGPALLAKFGFPSGICVTPDGSTIYVADHNTHVIRKINNGNVSNLAGIAYIAGLDDGGPSVATFNHPYGITLDNSGNVIVADEWNNLLRQITPAGNVITIAGTGLNGSADGPALSASFNSPCDVTVDNSGNIYVADGLNHIVRKIEAATWNVSTYAGTAGVTGATDGLGAAASFNTASGIAYSTIHNAAFVADAGNNLLRKITAVSPLQISLSCVQGTTICYGDSFTLTATPSGLSNYMFYDGANIIASSATNIATIQPLSSGTHSLSCTATDQNGLTAFSVTFSLTVRAQYVPSVTYSTLTFCNGDSALLTAESGSAYLWSDGSTSQSIYISSAGPHVVTVTSSSTGCKGSSAPITATLSAGPSATITSAVTTVCPGDSANLIASAGASWLWSTGETTQNIYAHTAGGYTVTVFDVSGCRNTSSPVTISFFTGSQAAISPAGPLVLIQGDSITLTSSAAASYLWSTGSANQSISVNASGDYILSITSTDGCISSDTVHVDVITLQQMVTALGPLTFCEGQYVVLQSFFSQGNQWYLNGMPLPGEVNQLLAAGDSGYYQVAALQNGNWIFSDSVKIDIMPAPAMAVVNDTIICEGQAPLLNASAEPFTSISWYDETAGTLLGTGNAYQSTALYQNTTFYIEVTGSNGCRSESTPLEVFVNPKAIADFIYTASGIPGNFTVDLTNTSLNGLLYTWVLVDTVPQVIASSVNATFNITDAGTYYFMLIADNAFGCSDSIVKKVIVGGSNEWFIPNTFTPNNDGKNDLFRVRGREVMTKEMKIYDQWGSLIYQTGENGTWDGTVNGSTVSNGTYMYRIVFTNGHEDENVNGSVTLIR